eukprot:2526675-Amphidinium_carterae.1
MGKGAKSGKGKYKEGLLPAEQARQFREDIQQALPEQARRRAATTLVAEEWSCSVVSCEQIDHRGGIAYCPKSQVASAIARIGYTRAPTAIVTTESPSALHLRGYPSQFSWVQLLVSEGGAIRRVRAQKYIVQCGFGLPVQVVVTGERIDIPTLSTRLVFKHREEDGTILPLAGADLFRLLADVVSPACVEDLVVRRNGESLTALVPKQLAGKLLRESGKQGLFIKPQGQNEEFELLWLPEGTALPAAVHIQQGESQGQGLAAKQTALGRRYAVRFRTLADCEEAAVRLQLTDQSALGRWKATGIPNGMSSVELFHILETHLHWQMAEVLHVGDGAASWLASAVGKQEVQLVQPDSSPIQFRAKACNAKARALVQAASIAAGSTASAAAPAAAAAKKSSTRADQQRKAAEQL